VTGQTTGQSFFRREVFRAEMERTKQRPIHIALALDVDPAPSLAGSNATASIDPNGSNARRLAKHFGRPEDYFLVVAMARRTGGGMSAHIPAQPAHPDAPQHQALEAERARDALAAMQALQRRMRDKVLAQPAWRLPEPKQRRA
jgi:hypothetical protein